MLCINAVSHDKGADKKPKLYVLNLISRAELTDTKHYLYLPRRRIPYLVSYYLHLDYSTPGSRSRTAQKIQSPSPQPISKIPWGYQGFLKPSMLKIPIFRQAVRTADGFRISERRCLRYSTYAYHLACLG